jgi:hypothetical protein
LILLLHVANSSIVYVAGSMLVLKAQGVPSIPQAERDLALDQLEYLQTALDEITYVWPVARHTSMSLRQLLGATSGP